jgi:thymidylate synthase (FAD)
MIEVGTYGFVDLVDMMGDDLRVCQSARVSTGDFASKGPEKDQKLINYLMKNKHETPFEKIVFEFHVKCPIFVMRQWIRHRIGSFNETSGRYKEFVWETFYPEEWRKQDPKNRQMSSKERFNKSEIKYIDNVVDTIFEDAEKAYENLLAIGVARELARIVMPLAIYTEFFWTVNFRSLMNFMVLRDHEHAQFEIQEFARAVKKIVKETNRIPFTWEAFEKYYAG